MERDSFKQRRIAAFASLPVSTGLPVNAWVGDDIQGL